MKYRTLSYQNPDRDMIETWGGYNHNLRIGDGEFYEMRNMTSDYYPVLSPRNPRGLYAQCVSPQAMISKDSLCYVDGENFIMNEYGIDMGLSDDPKQLISMGSYVIIMPDKKYINTLDITERGDIEAKVTTTTDVTFTLCDISAADYEITTTSDEAPKEPENGEVWLDTSTTPAGIKKWSETSEMWVNVPTVYIKIQATGIGKPFKQYDGVKISGITLDALKDLNNTMVIWEKGDDYIVVVGIMNQGQITITASYDESGEAKNPITIERLMPEMDFVIEHENRLWGCKYGKTKDGTIVNEIYSSKQGDFKNWNCFMGLSTDSYAVTCGTDGKFTGAITHLGYPLFFKENFLHKVYGNFPSNFQIQTTPCRGVQDGCSKSLAIVNETLYYKGRNGICAYDGSLPQEISYAFGNIAYSDAVAGAHGNKYYVSMKDNTNAWYLFVYDASKGLWHKENKLHALDFCSCRGEMYCIDADNKRIITLLGSGSELEEDEEWWVETGEIGMSSPDMKYVSRLTVRMSMSEGADVEFMANYDHSDIWTSLCKLHGTSLRSFSFPIRTRRCDHMKLSIIGKGMVKIYSITKTIEQGSELS